MHTSFAAYGVHGDQRRPRVDVILDAILTSGNVPENVPDTVFPDTVFRKMSLTPFTKRHLQRLAMRIHANALINAA